MLTKIQKWGNALALRIPEILALNAQLKNNSIVEVLLIDGKLVIKPLSTSQWTLEDLLSGITDDNIHREIDSGKAAGKEVW
jgi:antitoxin MazE